MTPRCGNCGYNLTGAPGNRCPECGKLFIEAGVIVRSDIRRSRWRVLLPLIGLLIGFTVVAMAFSMIRAAQARAAAEAARARAVTAFLQQSLASQNNQANSRSLTLQRVQAATQAASQPAE